MGVCNCCMFCCTLLYVHSSFAIILMGKRELVALLRLSSWCLVIVVWLFLTVPWVCLQFVIEVFPDHHFNSLNIFNISCSRTAQFYLRLGCNKSPPDPATPPVYLQYTTNGGVTWHTVEQFDFNSNSNKPEYIVLNLPEQSRSAASQLRWWQPSKDGTFMEPWAIDQVSW